MTQPPLWSRILIKLSHFLLSLSSAANIVIYSAKVSLWRVLRSPILWSLNTQSQFSLKGMIKTLGTFLCGHPVVHECMPAIFTLNIPPRISSFELFWEVFADEWLFWRGGDEIRATRNWVKNRELSFCYSNLVTSLTSLPYFSF